MKDPVLLSSILPNVFFISDALTAEQFQTLVLPSLKPIFAVKDPPQNMLVLLENLSKLQEKTSKKTFREGQYLRLICRLLTYLTDFPFTEVLPLVYHALESEHAAVQEKALATVPDLCESIDYAEVQGVLFPRVAVSLVLVWF